MDIQLEPKDLTQEYGVSTTKLNPKRDIRPITGSGTGDVVGPASAVNDDIAVYDGTSGKIIKDSGLKVTGFVKTDQASAQTIGDATNRLAKAYADDLSVFGNLEFYDPATENLS